ncbi:MAG: efflux RND transporter permease subunit [Treponemataceae bacterium]|nr:efflux RND transporter permease subunit [Treponemataceae bacterium]
MSFYSHKKAAALFLAALVLISAFSLKGLDISCRVPNKEDVFSVEFEYFGIDAAQIEKIIAEPLEEKISAIENLAHLTTTCEYSKCTTTAAFKKGGKNPYIALSEAADSLYRTLAKDAQRPRIYSSSAGQKAVFLAAFEKEPSALRKEIKAKLQSIQGVSEVLIFGNDREEIHAEFDGEFLSQAGLYPWNIASDIQAQNSHPVISKIGNEECARKLIFEREINSLEKIKRIPIKMHSDSGKENSEALPLCAMANIKYGAQKKDSIVRINSAECVLLSIKTSAPERTIKITKEAKRILKESLSQEETPQIIYDNGKEQIAMLSKIFLALLQSLLFGIAIVFLTFSSLKITALVSVFLCLNLLFCLAILSALKIPLDISTLSGITISIGLVSDSALFICDIFCSTKEISQFQSRLKKSIPALAISTVTTLSVIAPLVIADKIASGIKNIALTSGIMVAVSAVTASAFLPIALFHFKESRNFLKSYTFSQLLYTKAHDFIRFLDISRNFGENVPKTPVYKIPHKLIYFREKLTNFKEMVQKMPMYKILHNLIKILDFKNSRFSKIFLFGFASLLPAALFFFSAKNLANENPSKIIYAQIEYNPERGHKSTDKDSLPFVGRIQKIPGVDYVRSEARRGQVELEIVIRKESQRERIAKKIVEEKGGLEGFLYVPLSVPKSQSIQSVQVAVLGNESSTCRKIASEAAAFLHGELFFSKSQSQVILNFKDEEKIVCAKAERDFLSQNKIALDTLASFLRWNIFSPVADKILIGKKIYDIRAGEKKDFFEQAEDCDESTLSFVKRISFPIFLSQGEGIKHIPISTAFDFVESKMPSRIYRKNSRRAAFFTVEVQSKKTDVVFSEIKKSLAKLNLPEGYSFSFPRELENLKSDYSQIFAAFAFAVFAIFILMAAQCEDIPAALKALFTIPLSLFVPLLLRALFRQPLRLGDAVAMVFLCGLCVNNALYILNESKERPPKEASRALFKSIASSSLTTIFGALPVMIFAQDEFSKDLAFFMFWGTLATMTIGIFVFPRLLESEKSNL